MTRDLRRLADTTFDVLVVGAGIYGATIAWDAALRGLHVALVDRGDFGAATSANSLKTVHGGLRSLQRGALGEMRQFIRERRTLLRIAPHLVRPLTFVVPTQRHPVRNTYVMRVALAMNDAIARDRNRGVLPSHRLHPGGILSRNEMLRQAPDLDPNEVTGGATWCDAQMLNSERLTLAFVQSAARQGADVANHVAVERLWREGDRITGASARDAIDGGLFEIRARTVVNAAGAWAATLSADAVGADARTLLPAVSRALNVVTTRPGAGPAVGGLSVGRFFFRVPWRGVTMFGTSHDAFPGSPDAVRPTAADVELLLQDINRAFPGAPVSLDDAALVHWGLLPSQPHSGPHVQLAKQSLVRDHRADGVKGLVTVIGVRYTTARQTAQDTVDLVFQQLGKRATPSRSATTPLVGGQFDDLAALAARAERDVPSLTPADRERLVRNYGSEIGAVLALMREQPEMAIALSSRSPVTRAEVVVAARHEAALTLTDALIRRTEAGSAGHPGEAAAVVATELMARELGWDEARRTRERRAFDEYYTLAG